MAQPILHNDYNVEKLLLGRNFFIKKTYTNPSGSTATLTTGQIFGQILATAKVLPTVSTATDGSEMPRYVLVNDYTVLGNATITVELCVRGELNRSKVILGGSDTWDTAVRTVTTGGGTLEALFYANTHMLLIDSTEVSNYDN